MPEILALNKGVHLTLSVATVVRMSMVRNCLSTRLTTLIVPECTDLVTKNCSVYLDKKAIQELGVKEGLSFSNTRKSTW
jgi:hypothetical protein